MSCAPAGSLLRALQQIPDPRGRQGLRHACSAMLAAVVCALLCGARGYFGVAQWLHSQELELWHALGFTRIPPKLGAFHKLLMKLPVGDFEEAVSGWIEQLLPAQVAQAALQALAMDGKSVCGALNELGRVLHLLSHPMGFSTQPQPRTADTSKNSFPRGCRFL